MRGWVPRVNSRQEHCIAHQRRGEYRHEGSIAAMSEEGEDASTLPPTCGGSTTPAGASRTRTSSMRCTRRTSRTSRSRISTSCWAARSRSTFASLQAKLVAGRRGGYCFEQNLLFSAVLRAFGFAVTQPRRARAPGFERRCAAANAHDARGRSRRQAWLADVGFGGAGPLVPVPFDDGEPSRQHGWTFRIVDEGGGSGCCSPRAATGGRISTRSRWSRSIRVDYELANHYTSTHPSSTFTQVADRAADRAGRASHRCATATTARIAGARSCNARWPTTKCGTCSRGRSASNFRRARDFGPRLFHFPETPLR